MGNQLQLIGDHLMANSVELEVDDANFTRHDGIIIELIVYLGVKKARKKRRVVKNDGDAVR